MVALEIKLHVGDTSRETEQQHRTSNIIYNSLSISISRHIQRATVRRFQTVSLV